MTERKPNKNALMRNPITDAETPADAAIGALVGIGVSVIAGIPIVIMGAAVLGIIGSDKSFKDLTPAERRTSMLIVLAMGAPISIIGAAIGAHRNAPKNKETRAAVGAGIGALLGAPFLGGVFLGPAGAYIGASTGSKKKASSSRKRNGKNATLVNALLDV